LTPAIRATRTAPAGSLKAAGRGLTADRERFSLRLAVVVAQVAMSLVLLTGALLFVHSLRNLLTLDAGLQQDGLLIMSVDISPFAIFSRTPGADVSRSTRSGAHYTERGTGGDK
jgi:hypothetical protein